ncbi:hypothetical protein [Rhizobium halophilum]|uniref:hypothetical protein n=1 Tax=Rhizobium halophilum TaxID=2846852 RepID=UPI001EFCCC43|nr:hypothetical protein [Rhizobium halophilum]MCF6368354.1 hypothetical protein [Rhizobium halophilum]
MNDPKTPGAADGPKDEAIAPVGVAQPSKVERPDSEEQNKTEEHAAEIEKAKQTPDREVPLSTIRMPPD